MHRPTVGLIGAALLAGWIALWIWPLAWSGSDALQGAFLRVGVVMLAIWAAQPQLKRVPPWLFSLAGVLAIVVALRPRWAIIAVPLLVALWFLRPRK